MRKTSLLLLVALIIAIAGPVIAEDSLEFSEPQFIAYGVLPKWSPDGSKLAYVHAGSLFVAEPPEFANPNFVAPEVARSYQWVGNTEFVWRTRQRKKLDGKTWYVVRLHFSDIEGNVELLAADSVRSSGDRFPTIGKLMPSANGTIGYHERLDGDKSNTKPKIIKEAKTLGRISTEYIIPRISYVRANGGRRASFGNIWISAIDGSYQKQITNGPETWSFIALLSPNQELIATNNHRGEIVFIDTTASIRANAGRGEIGDWAPNSSSLLYSIASESEYDIVASELYVYNLVTNAKVQLTDTPELIEENPVWSSSGKFIAYGTMNAGHIYTIYWRGAK